MRPNRSSTDIDKQVPPDEQHVRVYFLQQGSTATDATTFFNFYKAKMWTTVSGHRLKDWKKLAWTWIHYKNCTT